MSKIIDITGKKFNMLTAISYSKSNNGSFWNFKCECGNIKEIRASQVKNGNNKSCGCLIESSLFKSKINIIEGELINNIKVLKFIKNQGHNKLYKFQCYCGNEFSSLSINVIRGNTNSCGCYKNKRVLESVTKHNLSKNKIYRLWHSMMRRCYDSNNLAYSNYGGRGIKVCERWHNIENFYLDMGDRPKYKSLDRINNNGSYELSNCMWSSYKQQSRNKRTNNKIIINNEEKLLINHCEELNIPISRIRARINNNWELEFLFKEKRFKRSK